MNDIRHDWSLEEIEAIYSKPMNDLIFDAQTVHRRYHDPSKVQLCTLLSIKTGGCPEDCKYCSQSAHYSTGLEREETLDVDEVLNTAKEAREQGASRFCMGAAWREVKDDAAFESVLAMVRGVRDLGMEACCTLGMLTDEQADRLAEAGLTAYNHNLDTGPNYYDQIITTRTYDDRLKTLASVRKAGITVCSGGILGLGETVQDRLEMISTLACLEPHPESVPINALVPVDGTPLGEQEKVSTIEMARAIATARIVMPKCMVRLSAGRTSMSDEAQALCFLAGANSIFSGDKLLTTPNPDESADARLFNALGLEPLEPATATAPSKNA